MSDDSFTAAELEAAARALHDTRHVIASDGYPSIVIGTAEQDAATVLAAVAPLIAARVRAEERANAYESAAHIVGDLGIGRPRLEAAALREAYDLFMADAAAIVRAHRTTPEPADGS